MISYYSIFHERANIKSAPWVIRGAVVASEAAGGLYVCPTDAKYWAGTMGWGDHAIGSQSHRNSISPIIQFF